MSAFNLPPGCSMRDIDGPPMPCCEKCGEEHNDEDNNGLCPDCQPVIKDKSEWHFCAWCKQWHHDNGEQATREQAKVLGEAVSHGICETCSENLLKGKP